MTEMKIVVDDKIPFIQPALRQVAEEVVSLPGARIAAKDVCDADILIVRTRTCCNQALLEGSKVRLVLTATIGYDHIDTAYMRQAGIEWHNCPGCNANSVAQYVHACLLLLQDERGLCLSETTLGIVGMGHVGRAVLEWVSRLRLKHILVCDPPLEHDGKAAPQGCEWSSMAQLQSEADVLTLHVPLTREEPYPTCHLIDAAFLSGLVRPCTIINAARGGVVDEQALTAAMRQGKVANAIIDTWENEPLLSRTLLNNVYIGTPHIAGYSADGKANASRTCLEAVCRHLGRPVPFAVEPPALPSDYKGYCPEAPHGSLSEKGQPLYFYNPQRDSMLLKACPDAFERLRGEYPLRRET